MTAMTAATQVMNKQEKSLSACSYGMMKSPQPADQYRNTDIKMKLE